jgi:hypothetical protein
METKVVNENSFGTAGVITKKKKKTKTSLVTKFLYWLLTYYNNLQVRRRFEQKAR